MFKPISGPETRTGYNYNLQRSNVSHNKPKETTETRQGIWQNLENCYKWNKDGGGVEVLGVAV